ncbi:MAG: HAMP domain-containing sensor histidine kinase [Pseudomonadota bacterium]|nr:HAMP domain-containing sensor histidine kinase [Pseudomonadota bacterium]
MTIANPFAARVGKTRRGQISTRLFRPRAGLLTVLYVVLTLAILYVLYIDFENRARHVAALQAEKYAMSWAEFLGHGIGREAGIFQGNVPTDADRRFMASALSVPGIFQFKLFAPNGDLLLVSNADGLAMSPLRDHNAEVAEVVAATGASQSFLKDGRTKADRPDVYVETYVPVRVGGNVIGVAEVYLDESVAARHFHLEFLALGVEVTGAIAVLLLVPCLTVYMVLRRLRAQRRDLIAQRQRAERAEQVKADFMACMSHDLRTPLNSILGFSDLMRHGIGRAKDAEACAEYADMIHNSGSNMLALVNDILDLSAVESTKSAYNARPLELGSVLSACIAEVRAANPDRDVAIHLDLSDPPPVPLIDPHAFNRIASNLLSNAIKFTADGGRIDIRGRMAGGDVHVDFIDTGVGLAPEEIQRIVEPFAQLGRNPHVAQKGVGLGLAIVKGLLVKAGGAMEITSTPGQGTTVTVTLPAA